MAFIPNGFLVSVPPIPTFPPSSVPSQAAWRTRTAPFLFPKPRNQRGGRCSKPIRALVSTLSASPRRRSLRCRRFRSVRYEAPIVMASKLATEGGCLPPLGHAARQNGAHRPACRAAMPIYRTFSPQKFFASRSTAHKKRLLSHPGESSALTAPRAVHSIIITSGKLFSTSDATLANVGVSSTGTS